jgi:hypothetical protein
MRHIVTLSTIPPRFADIGQTLKSLVAQRSRPDAVELYIPHTYRRFPEWGGALPDVPEGVTIRRIDQDYGPATKILPAAKGYRGQAVELIFADDDQIFEPAWSQAFLDVRKAHPEAVVCAGGKTLERLERPWAGPRPEPRAVVGDLRDEQARFVFGTIWLTAMAELRGKSMSTLQARYRKIKRSGYIDTVLGFAGVALRPEFLDDEAYVIPDVIWAVDDIWLSGHFARLGIPIWADSGLNLARTVNQTQWNEPLFAAVIDGTRRKEANAACVDYMRKTYGIWGGVATQST